MKTIIIGLAILAAAPAMAQTTAPAPTASEKDGCACCKDMGKQKNDCCDKMNSDSKDSHAGHDMAHMKQQ